MQQALQLDIPTLPQLPKKNPAEFMLPQALEGFAGAALRRGRAHHRSIAPSGKSIADVRRAHGPQSVVMSFLVTTVLLRRWNRRQ